jgi:hypothetical protein
MPDDAAEPVMFAAELGLAPNVVMTAPGSVEARWLSLKRPD